MFYFQQCHLRAFATASQLQPLRCLLIGCFNYPAFLQIIKATGGEEGRGSNYQLPTLNFWLSENCQKIFLSECFCQKILVQTCKMWGYVENPHVGKLKIWGLNWNFQHPELALSEICNCLLEFCQKFTQFVATLELSVPPNFLTNGKKPWAFDLYCTGVDVMHHMWKSCWLSPPRWT